MIVRPHAGSVGVGGLIALVAALGFAASLIMVKSLSRSEAAVSILFWMLVVQSLLGLIPALLVW